MCACVTPVCRYSTYMCVPHKPCRDHSGTGVPCPHPEGGQPWSSRVWWGRKQESLGREASMSVLGAGTTRLGRAYTPAGRGPARRITRPHSPPQAKTRPTSRGRVGSSPCVFFGLRLGHRPPPPSPAPFLLGEVPRRLSGHSPAQGQPFPSLAGAPGTCFVLGGSALEGCRGRAPRTLGSPLVPPPAFEPPSPSQ